MLHVEATLRNSKCIIKRSFIRDALQANILKNTLKEEKKLISLFYKVKLNILKFNKPKISN